MSMLMPNVKVGDGATICYVNDRYPATVIAVKGKRVTVQYDNYKVVKGSFMTNDAECEFTPNPNGSTTTFSLRKNGRFIPVGTGIHYGPSLSIGSRSFYQNPSI